MAEVDTQLGRTTRFTVADGEAPHAGLSSAGAAGSVAQHPAPQYRPGVHGFSVKDRLSQPAFHAQGYVSI